MSDKDTHVAALLRMRDEALEAWGRNTVVISVEAELERLGYDAEGKPVKRDAKPPVNRQEAPARRTVVHQP
jgi:hypothetical protein